MGGEDFRPFACAIHLFLGEWTVFVSGDDGFLGFEYGDRIKANDHEVIENTKNNKIVFLEPNGKLPNALRKHYLSMYRNGRCIIHTEGR